MGIYEFLAGILLKRLAQTLSVIFSKFNGTERRAMLRS
jgi:hypothetical protein